MSINLEFSDRLKQLPPYLFAEIDKAKRAARAQGRDILDLGVGDPDAATPSFIIEALHQAAKDGKNHHYAFDAGMPELRQTIARWCQKRFSIALDADTEIYPLIGSKEGLAHLPLGIVNPGDNVLVPDPAYPAYRSSVIFAGGNVVPLPLLAKNGFLPDLGQIKNAKAVFLNYPNNPTSATLPKAYMKDLVAQAKKEGVIIISDLAYSEVYFDALKPSSLFEIDGAKDVAIEFHSFSKTFYMTGWRIGWACGNTKLIAALAKVKTNIDSGIFQAIQIAGIEALLKGDDAVAQMRSLYQQRRDAFVQGLRNIGWDVPSPKATFYVWAPIPKIFKDSMEAAKTFLEKADIVATPGVGFGKHGEGFIRMTLTVEKEKLLQAVERLKKIL
ncbi:MAG TPA: LL-diaminopimelate aminotransferase [Candidatus Omnitrophota bacterium]|nr:LL-diaminopimelate aminotransferase [Candidatus Omnitrophota bacterium]